MAADPPGDRPARAFIGISVTILAFAILGGSLIWSERNEIGARPAEGQPAGTLYVESNSTATGQNAILAFTFDRRGTVSTKPTDSYPTGGTGAVDLGNTGVLDADQRIVVTPDHRFLYAVNQGSDTIAGFRIAGDGRLTALAGSPFPSGGAAPASLGVAGPHLVVVNKAASAHRDLKHVAPSFVVDDIDDDGTLSELPRKILSSPGASPTQALIADRGKVVVASEESGPLVAFALDSSGRLRVAPGSPQELPGSIFTASTPEADRWVLGMSINPTTPVLYAQVVNADETAVYRYGSDGSLSFVTAVANPGAFLPCWSIVNADGTRLYTDNAGNNTTSVFDVSDPTHPVHLQTLKLEGHGNPWDFAFDPTGRFIFLVDSRGRADEVKPGQGNEIHTLEVQPDGTVREAASSPVKIPEPSDTSAMGIVVLPNH